MLDDSIYSSHHHPTTTRISHHPIQAIVLCFHFSISAFTPPMPAKKKPSAKRPKKIVVRKSTTGGDEALFDRVSTILEQARANVVRAVNSHMVLAYWLIRREIVQEIQGGGKRAAYGKQVTCLNRHGAHRP
jgi:hypothetical protein